MPVDVLLFDTSIWVEFLQGHQTDGYALLYDYIDNNKPIVMTPTIVQEVAQGIRHDRDYEEFRLNAGGFLLLEADPLEAAYGAADLYRQLRKQGVTIRKPNDCLIAYFAMTHEVTLVHNDVDFDLIAAYAPLKVRRS